MTPLNGYDPFSMFCVPKRHFDPTTLVAETALEIADIFVRAVMGEKA